MSSSRRRFLIQSAALGFLAGTHGLLANTPRSMTTRAIPATGEQLPVIGMGTSGSLEVGADPAVRATIAEVLKNFLDGGGRLIDTAPSYGTAEAVLGDLVTASARERIFLATKLSSSGREAGVAQFTESLKRLKTDKVDLLQVHNLRDWRTQLALARELKAEGKVRYVGLTHYVDSAHEELADAVAAERPDFLQINYSVTQRAAEKRVFAVAQDKGVAVLANRNFDDGALFSKVGGRPLPAFAADVGATTWAQLFLKFALSHPAVTCVIPATGKPHRQLENLAAGYGPMLDERQRAALIAAVG